MLYELGLTGELLEPGQHGYTLEVSLIVPNTNETCSYGSCTLHPLTSLEVPASFLLCSQMWPYNRFGLLACLAKAPQLCGQSAFHCCI
jgi:hypothetical protein